MSKRLSQRSAAAFTMVEMAVAAAILALVVGGFFATFGGANQYAVNARLKTSAKIILGSCLNEAIGTPWTKAYTKQVHFQTISYVPFSPPNEGQNALPVPRADGEISLFTTPGGDEVVPATLQRWARLHPTRPDMLLVSFKIDYTYRGVASETIFAHTAVTRED